VKAAFFAAYPHTLCRPNPDHRRTRPGGIASSRIPGSRLQPDGSLHVPAAAPPAGFAESDGMATREQALTANLPDSRVDCVPVPSNSTPQAGRRFCCGRTLQPAISKGLAAAEGVLTVAGGRTSHAAVVSRQLGKICLT